MSACAAGEEVFTHALVNAVRLLLIAFFPKTWLTRTVMQSLYVTVHRKTDHFLQKLKFRLLLLVNTSIFAECNGS